MPVINIEGKRVTVGDEFLKMTPEQQSDAVDEIASNIGISPSKANSESPAYTRAASEMSALTQQAGADQDGQRSGVGMNIGAGLSAAPIGVLGAPVDASRWLINSATSGINSLTGSEIPQIPTDSAGGSEWIGKQFGKIDPRMDPANTISADDAERYVRSFATGAAGAAMPEAVISSLVKGGKITGQVADYLTRIFGDGKAAATTAIAGGASTASAEMAQDALPGSAIAPIIGGLAGGIFGGVSAEMLPRGGRAIADAAGEFVAPFTNAGRERIAGNALAENASNLPALRDSLENMQPDLVAGSKPTTFQATGDMGIGGLERGAQAIDPVSFADRRAAQNEARVNVVSGLQQTGAPEAVANTVRNYIKNIDDAVSNTAEMFANKARAKTDALGTGMTPEASGSVLRSTLEQERLKAKMQERALWKAVDPDGTLALAANDTQSTVGSILQEMPKSAKPMDGEEAAIFSVAQNYDGVVKLSELQALQSRLKTAMRDEKFKSGESDSYRRMSILNTSIQNDLESAVAAKATQEADAVAAGTIKPDDTIASRLEKLGAPKTGTSVYTPSGRKVDVNYEVVDASKLIPSNTPDMRPNPQYAPELQPRDRTRAASDAQVARIAGDLQPERLGPSTTASDGAPIVGPDGMVESGNARVLGIRRAYAENGQSAQKYRSYLADQGYNIDGMKEPVLVRRRVTDLAPDDRARFAQEANASTSMAMSASEKAATDASRITDDLISQYNGGDVADASNRDFVRNFLKMVPEKGEEGAFVTADGSLSLDGAQRMRNALLQSAYKDGGIVAAMADVGDENIRTFGRALSDISGDVARLNSAIKAGRVDASADLSAPLAEAASFVQNARKKGITLSNAVAQQDAFSQVSPEAMEVLQLAYGEDLKNRLSNNQFVDIMRGVIRDSEQQTTDARLFGDAIPAAEILSGARSRYGSTGEKGTQSVPVGGNRTGNGSVRPEEWKPPTSEAGSPDLARNGSQEARILEKPSIPENFDRTALGRLKAARAATKQRAETFDNGILAPLRKRDGSQYTTVDSVVPERIFAPGAKGFDTVKTYRTAVGDPAAMEALQGYVIDRLRKTALRPDGTLDPNRVNSFITQHADAFRAFPDLKSKFVDAAAASKAMNDAVKMAADRGKALKDGVITRFSTLADPEDITKTVGQIFQAKDSAQQMLKLRNSFGGNAEAKEGLRKAVADYISNNLIGNTEAGTSGKGTVKSDAFQNFMKKNKSALRSSGFNDDEINTMQRVAEDLQRANRSIASVKNPGGSNTAQDNFALKSMRKDPSLLTSVMEKVGFGALGIGTTYGSNSLVLGVAASGAAALVSVLRARGLNKANEILVDALLNPERARILLRKAKTPQEVESAVSALKRSFAKSAVISGRSTAQVMQSDNSQSPNMNSGDLKSPIPAGLINSGKKIIDAAAQ